MYLGVGMDNDLVTRNDGGDNGAAKLRAISIHVRIHGIKNFYQQGGSPGQSVQCPAVWMESGLQVKSQNRSWRDADRFYARFLGIKNFYQQGGSPGQSVQCPAVWMESGLQVKSQNRSWRDADRFYARFLGISDDCKESAKRQSKECLPEHR